MCNFSEETLKKLNALKKGFLLCFTMVLVLLLVACNNGFLSEQSVSVEQEKVIIEIKAPSDGELTIAPGRPFKVSGSLSGEIPDDAILRVTLLDAAGKAERNPYRRNNNMIELSISNPQQSWGEQSSCSVAQSTKRKPPMLN